MKAHLIGIGGVGMSALATALVKTGVTVTGADRNLETPNIAFLRSLGVECFPDDASGVDASVDEIIVSTAIEATNPALVKAKALSIPVTHRAKALSRLLSPYPLVAVVGTCGKSTVTAMLGHILAEGGLDPICVNGANVPGWLGAVRVPNGVPRYAVAEVDESDKSLLAFKPYAAIVTNASADHYSEAEMNAVFDDFVKDCPGPVIDARGETYAPELFNEQNASLAIRMAVALGCDRAGAEKAMESFGGVERRLQRISPPGHCRPVIYDDYAHNPEKLRSMCLALQKRHPGGLCVLWRPHGYAPLRKMLDALAAMFAEVLRPTDLLILLPVYDAGGTTDRSINSDALLAKISTYRQNRGACPQQNRNRGACPQQNRGVCPQQVRVEMATDLELAFERMCALSDEFEAMVTAGARDPGLPVLAQRLATKTWGQTPDIRGDRPHKI